MYEVLFPGLLNTHTCAHTEKKKKTLKYSQLESVEIKSWVNTVSLKK